MEGALTTRRWGWLSSVVLGLFCLGFEVLRIGHSAERHEEWWASSTLIVGLALAATIVTVALSARRATYLEGAFGLFALSLLLLVGLGAANASTDYLAGLRPGNAGWLRGHGCMGPIDTVGGRLSAVECAFLAASVIALGLLPAARPGFAALRGVLVGLAMPMLAVVGVAMSALIVVAGGRPRHYPWASASSATARSRS